jgi:hypothetical protein
MPLGLGGTRWGFQSVFVRSSQARMACPTTRPKTRPTRERIARRTIQTLLIA